MTTTRPQLTNEDRRECPLISTVRFPRPPWLRRVQRLKVRDGRHGEGHSDRPNRGAPRARHGRGLGERGGRGPQGREAGGGRRDGAARNGRGKKRHTIN